MSRIVEHGHHMVIAIGSGSQEISVLHAHRVSKPDHKHSVTCEEAHMPVEGTRPMDESDLASE